MKYIRTFEDNEKRLATIIANDIKHKFYKETTKKAEFWKQVVTGVNQDEHVLDFRPSETEQQKKVRLNAYNPLTPYLVEKVKTIYSEADRSNKVRPKESFGEASEDKIERFHRLKNQFHGEQNTLQYLNKNFLDRVIVDQNSYEVIEYKTNQDGIIDVVYPKYYESKDVVDDNYFNGWLQYVVVRDKITVNKKGKAEERFSFTLHAPDYKLKGRLVDDSDDEKPEVYENGNLSRGYFINIETDKNKKVVLFFEYIATFSKRVPAIRYDLTRCPEFKQINESVLRPAKGIFLDNIQKKSNFDTILKAHGIYRTFARVPRCDYQNKDTGQRCKNGRMTTGETCPACEGTGLTKVHNTDLDLITFPIENDIDPKERINLQDMVYTENVNPELINLYEDQVDKSETRISLALFNTNIFDRKELLAGTATEIRAQFKNVNNKLYKYEVAKSRILKFINEQVAIYSDIEDYQYNVIVPSDFDLETIDDLLTIREKAQTSGAPTHFINEIDRKILAMEFEDEPETAEEIQAFEKFKPFNDISENERISIVSLLPENDPTRTRYLYYSEIVNEIKNSIELNYMEGEDLKSTDLKFYQLPYEIQKLIFEYYSLKYQSQDNQEFTVIEEDE